MRSHRLSKVPVFGSRIVRIFDRMAFAIGLDQSPHYVIRSNCPMSLRFYMEKESSRVMSGQSGGLSDFSRNPPFRAVHFNLLIGLAVGASRSRDCDLATSAGPAVAEASGSEGENSPGPPVTPSAHFLNSRRGNSEREGFQDSWDYPDRYNCVLSCMTFPIWGSKTL